MIGKSGKRSGVGRPSPYPVGVIDAVDRAIESGWPRPNCMEIARAFNVGCGFVYGRKYKMQRRDADPTQDSQGNQGAA